MLGGIHHVSINVDDAATCSRFYAEVVGLRQIDRPDFGFPGAWFEAANGVQVHLIQIEGWVAPKGQHFAFAVDDVEAAVAQLRGRGVQVGDPVPIPGAGRQAFLDDPAGNRLELNQSSV